MAANKYLILFIISLGLTAASRHFYIKQYYMETSANSMTQGLDVVQRSAGAFFSQDSADSGMASPSAREGHEHEHEHHHVTGMHLADIDDAGGSLASVTHHEGDEHHEHHKHHDHGNQDPSVSPGFVLLLRQLGFAELAANLLWIQMDSDSHRDLWHRVEFALELIPALDPTFIDAYLLRAFLLDEYQGRHDDALQILEDAVKQIPNRIELWQQIGLFCINTTGRHGPVRRLQRALEAFRNMCAFTDRPLHSIRMVAATLAAMERRDEAIQLLQNVASAPERPPDQQRLDRFMIDRILAGDKF